MDDGQEPTYEKFVVMSMKGETEKSVPWTGIDQTLNYVKEQLEDGCTVQIKPFTRDKWKEWA